MEKLPSIDFLYRQPVLIPISINDLLSYAERHGIAIKTLRDLETLELQIKESRTDLQTTSKGIVLLLEDN